MDHDLTRELASWAERLGWRWVFSSDKMNTSRLLNAEGYEMGRSAPHLGDPWGWVLDAGDGKVEEGDAPIGRVAKGILLAEALLWHFLDALDGWQVHRDSNGIRVRVEGGVMLYCRRSVSPSHPRDWVVSSNFDETATDYDDKQSALVGLVCQAMDRIDEAGLVPGGEGDPEPVDDAEIDLEQLRRVGEALEGFE